MKIVNKYGVILKTYLGVVLACLFFGMNAVPVQAGEERSKNWEFTLAPMYVWAVGMSGSQSIGPVNVPVDLNFEEDILKDLNAFFSFHLEAKHGRWTPFADYLVARIEPTAGYGNGQSVDATLTNDIAELGFFYDVSEGKTIWQVLAGLRWTNSETEVDLNGKILNGQLFDVKNDWMDGIVGFRLIQPFGQRWDFAGRVDIGAGGSDFVYNVDLLFKYRFATWGSLFTGYRLLSYDYDNGESGIDRFVYDLTWHGPGAGLAFHW